MVIASNSSNNTISLRPSRRNVSSTRAQRIKGGLVACRERFVSGFFRKQAEQLLEELREREPALLLKIDKREGVGVGLVEKTRADFGVD